jgi:hypothetical protein
MRTGNAILDVVIEIAVIAIVAALITWILSVIGAPGIVTTIISSRSWRSSSCFSSSFGAERPSGARGAPAGARLRDPRTIAPAVTPTFGRAVSPASAARITMPA